MSEGGVGDTVTVQNPASFRMVTATITGAGTVRAEMASPPPTPPVDRFPMRKLILRNAAFALLGLGLAGCGAVDRIEISARRRKWRRWAPRLNARSSPAFPAPPPITHANNSLWQPGAKSFFRDPRASNVGDIITVNITVSDAAKLSNSTARSRANSGQAPT